jgi:predicted nucleic acid-binding protein
MIYLDSSILLELYLGRERADESQAILESSDPKIASLLLMIEVPIALRRVLHRTEDERALASALERFDDDVKAVGLLDSLTDVAIRVRSDRRFARCRSLDAVHACSALLMREWTGHAVRLETFDARLNQLAGQLGLR